MFLMLSWDEGLDLVLMHSQFHIFSKSCKLKKSVIVHTLLAVFLGKLVVSRFEKK